MEPIQPVVKQSTFLVTLLSVLLLISVFIAGFFAYQTQNLVKELTKLQVTQTPVATASPSPTASSSATLIPSPVACTMEAKICPDGSYVGRTGPNCEFSLCPTPKN